MHCQPDRVLNYLRDTSLSVFLRESPYEGRPILHMRGVMNPRRSGEEMNWPPLLNTLCFVSVDIMGAAMPLLTVMDSVPSNHRTKPSLSSVVSFDCYLVTAVQKWLIQPDLHTHCAKVSLSLTGSLCTSQKLSTSLDPYRPGAVCENQGTEVQLEPPRGCSVPSQASVFHLSFFIRIS